MKIENRPYAGNWTSDIKNKYRRVRSWTPDAIVQFNGDTSVPGCNECKNKIDFQAFITSVSVGAGVTPNSNSCSINAIIPRAYGDSVFKDGEFILIPGVEVNVYFRGFFKTDELLGAGDTIRLNEEDVDLSKVEMRPYYPVFHGVLSGVDVDQTLQGSYSISMSCKALLAFWENQQVNTNAGYFAAQPTESKGSIQLTGHKYTDMTPHQIIYDLYLDSGGSAQGTGFALQKTDNMKAKSVTGQQFYSLALRYWENRFENGLYGLRMYGVSGRLYSATETALLSDVSIKGKKNEFVSVIKEALQPHADKKPSPLLKRFMEAGLVQYDSNDRKLLRLPDLQFLTQASEDDRGGGVNVRALKEFITDIGALGQVSMFESSFTSKLSLAGDVAQKCGYEFFQDLDGDLVFKPPMYNLDTSDNRVYRIQREDILSISFGVTEPEATYVICKGGPFRNISGVIDSGEWGVKGTYVDYHLVAKFGWKEHSFDTSFYNTKRQAYYAAVVELDRINKGMNTCNISIPLRPEIKPGYPIYIEHIDCFYYVESVSHSFSYGSSATTGLTLTCRRKKFIPPGDADVDYANDPARAVDLGRTDLPKKYLYKKVKLSNDLGDSYETRKIAGFPNVVMALDPTKIDPGFLTFSIDFQAIGGLGTAQRTAYRNNLIIEAKRLKILEVADDGDLFNGPWVLKLPNTNNPSGEPIKGNLSLEGEGSQTITRNKKGVVVTRRDGSAVTRKTSKKDGVIIKGESELEIAAVKRQQASLKAAQLAAQGQRGKAQSIKDREQAQLEFEQTIQSLRGNADSGFTIVDLLTAVKEARYSTKENSAIEAGSTANILRLLQNKKASFGPQLPGYYRYFSSSHPAPEHQAPDLMDAEVTENAEQARLTLKEGRIDDTDVNMVFSEGGGDSIYYSEGLIKKGLLTRTQYSNDFEIVPTKDILTLSFQKHGTLEKRKVTTTSPKASGWGVRGQTFWTGFFNNIRSFLTKEIQKGTQNARVLADSLFSDNFAGAFFNSVLPNKMFPDTTDNDLITTDSVFTVVGSLRGVMIKHHEAQRPNYYGDGFDAVTALNGTLADMRSTFKNADRFFPSTAVSKTTAEKTTWSKDTFVSPIFPVSDENGFEVFGAYQYGRGLEISKGGSFDQLLVQDPTRVFSAKDLQSFVLDNNGSPEGTREQRGKVIAEKLKEIEKAGRLDIIDKIASSRGLERGDLLGNVSQEMLNKLMTTLDEQVITNVPKRISEITPPSRGDAMCRCKAQSTDLELLALASDTSNFVSVGNAIKTEMDIVNNVGREIASRETDYRTHEAALRHDLDAQGGEGTFKRLTGAFGRVGGSVVEDYENLVSELGSTEELLSETLDTLVERAGEIGTTDRERVEAAKKLRGRG